jgi:hypothetical protein
LKLSLGVMLQLTTPVIMLSILLVVYVVILGLVILFILIEANDKLTLDTQGISPFAILSAGVILVSLFLFLYSSDLVKIPGNNVAAQTQPASSPSSTACKEVNTPLAVQCKCIRDWLLSSKESHEKHGFPFFKISKFC